MAGPDATQSLDSTSAGAQATGAFAPGEKIDGTYRIERLLGQGGGGAVYLVHHEGLDGARFALKVLHGLPGRSAEMLAREGRLAARVRSAHVVKVTAIGHLSGGTPYLIMEYVDGPTLDEWLAARELAPGEAIDCGRQLCLAIEAAHCQGLIHGDVSMRNIFVTTKPDGSLHLQLGDFGLARSVQGAPGATTSVELGAGRGTPRFMAPEVISGDRVDERSDIFSAGVVLYRLLSGCYPFDGASAREILTATLRGEPVPLGQRRDGVRAFGPAVMRCLAPDPAARFGSARALREALESARSAGPGRRSWEGRRRVARPAARAAIAALCVAGLSWTGLRWGREHARIPIGAALQCPATLLAPADGDEELAQAVAKATCAGVGAALDVDWGGGPEATRIATRLRRDAGGAYQLDVEVAGRREQARGPTPLAAAQEAARRLLARVDRPPMSPAEVRDWGALDAQTAALMRAVWRRRTALVIDDCEQEPRAVLLRDPGLPLAHLLLAEVERDPVRRREARAQALAHADRLPPDRAAALAASIAVGDDPDQAEEAIERLRRAYSSSPDDLDIGVLYTGALVAAGRRETALALVEQMHARFPRRAVLAVHYGNALRGGTLDTEGRLVAWLVDVLPESRAVAQNIYMLVNSGRVSEADAALGFAHRLGVAEEKTAIPEVMVALSAADPARIERATAAYEGSTRSWSQVVGAWLQLAGLLVRGQVAAAETFLQTHVAGRRAAGDQAGALTYAAGQLRLARLAGGPTLGRGDLAWMEQVLDREKLPLSAYAFARTELLLTLARDGGPSAGAAARSGLDQLDAEIARRAGADALARAAARLRTLPLARLCRGDVEAASRWRDASAAWLDDRVQGAYDAALALEAAGDTRGSESAYRLAASPYSVDRHPLEFIAARLRLAGLLDARGRADEARALRAQVDLAWANADPGLRETFAWGSVAPE